MLTRPCLVWQMTTQVSTCELLHDLWNFSLTIGPYIVADAPLTTLGQEQSRQLNEATKNGVQKTAELLVTSPVSSIVLLFICLAINIKPSRIAPEAAGDHVARLSGIEIPIRKVWKARHFIGHLARSRTVSSRILKLQANSSFFSLLRYPCDTPTHPISALKASNGGIFSSLDFSALSPDYASKEGIFAPANGVARAKLVRKWLRERPEREIVGAWIIHLCRCRVMQALMTT